MIANTSARTITISTAGGNGTFNDTSVVILQGYGALATTHVIDTLITAVVPAGVPGVTNGRAYDVQVINPDNTSCSITILNGLRVMSPAPATNTPEPTETPAPTDFVRPQVTILSYVPSTKPPLYPGQEFEFAITLQNNGQIPARNIGVFFPDSDVIPRDAGGTRAVGDLLPGGTVSFSQPLRVNSGLGGDQAAITVQISYYDEYGKEYQETSVLSFEVAHYASTPTPLPTLSVRPQLVIETTTTTPAVLTPGATFQLDMSMVNVSTQAARQVVVTLTPSAASTTVLAPLNGANVRYVDRLDAGQQITLSYDLAIDGAAVGGLAPIQVDLSYIDDFNVQHDESALISLSVETLATFQVDFFDALTNPILVGDTFDLPVEVINIGSKSLNVNTVEVVNTDGKLGITNGSIYVGPIDAGTSGTILASAEAQQAGDTQIEVRVHYLDAFQQNQVYTAVLPITVEAAPLSDTSLTPNAPTNGGGLFGRTGSAGAAGSTDGSLTFGQRVIRAILGFFGLGTRPVGEALRSGTGAVGGGFLIRRLVGGGGGRRRFGGTGGGGGGGGN